MAVKQKKEARQIKSLKKRNEWFNSLKPAEKRVEIAKDLIDSLYNNKFSVRTGSYLKLYYNEYFSAGRDLQVYLSPDNSKVECKGCGIAGLLYSRIVLGNNAKVKDCDHNCSSIDYYSEQSKIHNALKGVFSEKQLNLIEVAFEYTTAYTTLYLDRDKIEKALDFADNYSSPSDRLIAICNNIIKNKGTFKP